MGSAEDFPASNSPTLLAGDLDPDLGHDNGRGPTANLRKPEAGGVFSKGLLNLETVQDSRAW